MIGKTLSNYRIIEKLGQGGMGEVFLAEDIHLNRRVAIKVLPDAFAIDPERLARFDREAKLLASLSHQNIAAIHGLEKTNGSPFLVMELVEGETLPCPVPVETAIQYAKQIAEALEYAHERGVMHRDLKPANVKVTPEGVVKLLDFGLAKAIEDPGGMRDDPSQSPTVTLDATQMGVILGTAAYMSPEQASGKTADRRADIWSFGAVLYEMLTGKKAFAGESVSDTLATVLKVEPDWGALPAATPASVRHLVRRCLTKDRRQRLQAIGEARIVLAEPGGAMEAPAQAKARATWLPWTIAGALVIGLATVSWMASRAVRYLERPLMRLSVDLGPDAIAGLRSTAVLSPDGTRIVFPIRANGVVRLSTRTLDQPQATPISGTEGGSDPFLSPDGQWLGFFANGKLKKVEVQGGAPVSLCDVASARGGSWGEDGNIVLATDYGTGLTRVPSAGGAPQALTKLGIEEASHRWPQVLPGARTVLFTAGSNPFNWDDAFIDVVSLKTGEVRTVQRGGYFGRYLPSANGDGHLLYIHEGTLFAVAFDPGRLETSGAPVPLLEDLAGDFSEAGGQFDCSRSGSFVYLSGKATRVSSYPIVWMDSSGKTIPLVAKPGPYGAPRFSPDGGRLAFTAPGGKGSDVWVYDWERDIPTQVTFTGPGNLEMAWTPDGRHLVFGSNAGGTAALWWMRADGSGAPQKLLEQKSTGIGLRPQSFTPDGKRLAFDSNVKDTVGVETWTLPLDISDAEHPKPGTPELFLSGPQREVDAAFSPDGKWMAYASNESGIDDIFVRLFPGPGGKVRISTSGGKYPMWSRDGKELFYLSLADDRIMVTDYAIRGDSFSATKPRVWSDRQVLRPNFIRVLDMHPDGKRFAVFARPEVEAAKGNLHVTFLLNLADELRRRVPTGGK